MPLPFLAWGAAAVGAAAVGYFANRSGKKKGYEQGYDRAIEDSEAKINELIRQLDALQRQREHVKEQFRGIIEDMSNLETMDKGFFAKIAALLRGYTHFHIYVVGVISVAKARSMELSLPNEMREELKGIVFGVLQGGFPEQLKKDVNEVWISNDFAAIQKRIVYCQKKMPDHLALEYRKSLRDIEESVAGLYELNKQENAVQSEIKLLRNAG